MLPFIDAKKSVCRQDCSAQPLPCRKPEIQCKGKKNYEGIIYFKNYIFMKKLIYGGIILAILGTSFFSCEKKNVKESDETTASVIDSQYDENGAAVNKDCEECWALTTLIITIIAPDALHRGTSSRPRDQVNCGCTQCFGMCWRDNNTAPYTNSNGDGLGEIAISEIVDGWATIYFLNGLPSNFETEFGIDDPYDIELDDNSILTLKTGEYKAVESNGVINPEGENLQVYGYVRVEAVN